MTSAAPDRMNLPNRLTVARLFLTVLFVAAIESGMWYGKTAGLLIFAIASFTDYLDGHLARKYSLVTNFGKLMDPLADKILTASALILLIPAAGLPAWIVVLIVSREFLVTGLRLLAVNQGYVMAADKLGKHKTAWQIVMISYYLCLLAVSEWIPGGMAAADGVWAERLAQYGLVLAAIAAALTCYSGAAYLYSNWGLLRETPVTTNSGERPPGRPGGA